MIAKRYLADLIAIFLLTELTPAAYANCGRGGLGQRPRCPELTSLPIVSFLNPLLEIPCDLGLCLLDSSCELECPSELLTAATILLKVLGASASCDKGLVVCPAKNILHIEQCLATGGKGQ